MKKTPTDGSLTLSSKSYLNMPNLLSVAFIANADAIHPGYAVYPEYTITPFYDCKVNCKWNK
jgi:biotin carboxylase